MTEGYVATGTLKDGRRVDLDEHVPMENARVKVTIELLQPSRRRSVREVTAEMRRRQREQGHVPLDRVSRVGDVLSPLGQRNARRR